MFRGIDLASYIETTNLSPTAKREDIIELCNQAVTHKFYAVCIQPYYLPLAASLLQGNNTKLVTVAGFPFGCNDHRVKVRETELAVKSGAHEVDLVINIAALKNGDDKLIIQELSAVAACGAMLKVIIETGYLDREEIVRACSCIQAGGAHYVKTCTGFGPRGVTADDVILLRTLLPPSIGIKAAGGIKAAATAIQLIDAGANRLGTSMALALMQEFKIFRPSTRPESHQ